MKHVLRIANQHDAFYCEKNRLHLYYYNPTGEAEIVTEAIKAAILNKKVIDVNKTTGLVKEKKAVEAPKEEVKPEPVEEVKPEPVEEVQEEVQEEEVKEEPKEEAGFDVDSASREELLAYIKAEDITFKSLNIKGNSDVSKIRKALKARLAK